MTDHQFSGFGPNTISFFEGLQADNSKAYFQANRNLWETEIRDPLEDLLAEAAAELRGTVKIFRIHRDVRFSHDKSPYKTNTAGLVLLANGMDGAIYASISSDGFYAGTGYYQMAKDQVDRFRAAAADDRTGPDLIAAMDKARESGLEIGGDALKTAPKGYPKDHPRIELLKHKWLIFSKSLTGDAIHSRAALDHAWATWRAAKPAIQWFDQHVGPSTLPPDPRARP